MENSSDELKQFKSIDLISFMKQYGYFPKTDKDQVSAGRRATLVKGDETLFVKRYDNGDYVYINPHNTYDKGSIIDFVCSRDSLTLGQARKKLRLFLSGTDKPLFKEVSFAPVQTPISYTERNKLASDYFAVMPLTDFSYLESRGISKDVVNSEYFIGKIGNKMYTDEKGNEFFNTVAPIINEKGIVGLEVKNFGFKGTLEHSDKQSGIFVSNVPKNKPFDLIFMETWLDSVSFHELQKGNNLYAASNGSVTDEHILLFQKLIDKHNPNEIILAGDNDPGGARFNLSLMGSLQSSKSLSQELDAVPNRTSFSCKAGIFQKYWTSLRMEFVLDPNESKGNIVAQINDQIKKVFPEDYYEFKPSVVKESDTSLVVDLVVPNTMQRLEGLYDVVRFFKPTMEFKIEKPVHKDFTQDLEIKKGIIKQESAKSKDKNKGKDKGLSL